MDPRCQTYREALLGAAFASPPQEDHAASCERCAAWARSGARQAEAVRGLRRLPAPFELDGSVVAALGAGQRQARAARAIAELLRVSSPAELESAVDAELDAVLGEETREADGEPERLRAPAVLDRLVNEELADPVRARVSRYLGSLRRRRAPQRLRARLALSLEEREFSGPRRIRGVLWGGLSLAAGALLAWYGSLSLDRWGEGRRQPAGYDFAIERMSSSEGLSPMALGHLDGLSGGLLLAGGL